MHSVTHGSEAPLQYEEEEMNHPHQGAPVTVGYGEDPYSPFSDGGSYMGEPSAINVRPPSHMRPQSHMHPGHQSGGDYFEQPYSDSPRGTVVHPASVHEVPVEHVETAHPNVIHLGEHAHQGHAEPEGHVAIAGVSRQPVRIFLSFDTIKKGLNMSGV